MEAIFSEVLNMSLTASVVILVVLLARVFLKKAPKIYSYALWSVVLFRLLCPVSIQSPVSVLEVTGPEVTRSEGITTSVSYIPADYVRVEPQVQTPTPAQTSQPQEAEKGFTTETAVVVLWLTGVAVMLLRSAAEYVQLRRKLVGATPFRDNVYLADHISTPFAMGILLPKIYLPSNIPSWERRYIVAHERHHIRRGDHIIKLLAYFALSLHWFNPLAWVAFVQAGKDMEMSCDEAVIKKLGPQIRADYSASLLRLATGQRIISGAPLAFGEGDTKGRIRNMARWKKPKLWVSAAAVAMCIGILIACGMNPEAEGGDVSVGALQITLPDGFRTEEEENTLTIYKRRKEVGGIYQRNSTEVELLEDRTNMWDWVCSLNIPENVPQERYMMWVQVEEKAIGSAAYGNKGKEETIHYFFDMGDMIYGLWLNAQEVSEEERSAILDSVRTKEEKGEHTDSAVSDLPFQLGQLPEGYYAYGTEDNGKMGMTFIDDANTVGGVTAYPIPEGVYDPEDSVFDWLEEVGIPDFEDTSLAYVGGITAPGGGWLAEFTSDVPEGTAITVDRRHHFYPIGDTVYDIWFDMMLIDLATSEEIRQAVKLPEPVGQEAAETGEKTAEDIAFEKVKAVFDTVQSGSYQILTQQKNEGNEGPSGYVTTYFDDGENWLRLHEVLTEGTNQTEAGDYYNRMAHLTHKGFHYSNDGHWGEQGAIQWSAITAEQMDTAREGPVSKLASFQWIKANVTYMDTLTDETGECVMFRIDKMYADQEDYTDHYFANFYFDPSGNFRNAQFQVNLYQDNAFTVTESIVTLDHETVAEQINSYYGYGIPVKESTGKPVLSGDAIDANVEMLQYGILTMTLPDDYTCREESGSIILTREGTDVGGITCWAMPEVPLENDTLAWYRAMGLPEAQESDVPIAYMGGSSPYGDIEAEFFNELDPEALNVEHHFFIDGDIVYDVYYDQNVLSDGQAEKFLKTIAVSGEPVVTPDPSEEESLIKCRNVLSLVQSGSYAIARDRKNQGTVALNDYSYRRFWQHDGNWLSIAEIPESGGSSFFYYMEVDGVHYNTERTGWDENGPIWAEQRKVEVAKPWLATFRWDPDIVTYENTLVSGGEECVMLRIDEPYPYGSDNSESYFVNFYFADGGAFLRVELQVNLFLSNAFTETESIITLDAETIAAEIEKEYLRAIS